MIQRLHAVSLRDHVSEARQALETAQEQARALLRAAHAEARQLRHAASERGFEAGFRKGYESGAAKGREDAFQKALSVFQREQASVCSLFEQTIADFEQRKRDLFIDAEQDLIRFAVQVTQRLTGYVGQINREAVLVNLREALRHVEFKTNLEIHASAADAETLERFAGELGERLGESQHVSVVVDPAMAAGGCRVVTPELEVDATLETRLAEIAALLIGDAEATA